MQRRCVHAGRWPRTGFPIEACANYAMKALRLRAFVRTVATDAHPSGPVVGIVAMPQADRPWSERCLDGRLQRRYPERRPRRFGVSRAIRAMHVHRAAGLASPQTARSRGIRNLARQNRNASAGRFGCRRSRRDRLLQTIARTEAGNGNASALHIARICNLRATETRRASSCGRRHAVPGVVRIRPDARPCASKHLLRGDNRRSDSE